MAAGIVAFRTRMETERQRANRSESNMTAAALSVLATCPASPQMIEREHRF